MEEKQYNLDVNMQKIQKNSYVYIEKDQNILDNNMETEQNNYFDNVLKDSDDSIKDRDFVVSRSSEDF